MSELAVMPLKAGPVAQARRIGPSIAAVADEIESSQTIP